MNYHSKIFILKEHFEMLVLMSVVNTYVVLEQNPLMVCGALARLADVSAKIPRVLGAFKSHTLTTAAL